jgi:hypothetical protein
VQDVLLPRSVGGSQQGPLSAEHKQQLLAIYERCLRSVQRLQPMPFFQDGCLMTQVAPETLVITAPRARAVAEIDLAMAGFGKSQYGRLVCADDALIEARRRGTADNKVCTSISCSWLRHTCRCSCSCQNMHLWWQWLARHLPRMQRMR